MRQDVATPAGVITYARCVAASLAAAWNSWWGRGAIQTTGPHNYAALQRDVISRMEGHADTDLCANPEAMCQSDELKWVGALHYWTTVVQQSDCFFPTLEAYAENLGDGAAVQNCYSFPAGVGGSINNGFWNSHAHGEAGRLRYFEAIMGAIRTAADAIDSEPSTGTPPYTTIESGTTVSAMSTAAETTAATTASTASTAATTDEPRGETPLVGFFCPGCSEGVDVGRVVDEMHPAYSTLIVQSMQVDIQGQTTRPTMTLTPQQVSQLRVGGRVVLLEITVPVLNCSRPVPITVGLDIDSLIDSHGFDGMHWTVGTLLCTGVDGGDCDLPEYTGCAAMLATLSRQVAGIQQADFVVSVGANAEALNPSSAEVGATLNVVALLLAELGTDNVNHVVMEMDGAGADAFDTADASNYLSAIDRGFTLTSGGGRRRARERRQDQSCYSSADTFGCVVNPAYDPALVSWCMSSCVNGPDWHSACSRAGEAGGQGSFCSCFCTGGTGVTAPVEVTTTDLSNGDCYTDTNLHTCLALDGINHAWCNSSCRMLPSCCHVHVHEAQPRP